MGKILLYIIAFTYFGSKPNFICAYNLRTEKSSNILSKDENYLLEVLQLHRLKQIV